MWTNSNETDIFEIIKYHNFSWTFQVIFYSTEIHLQLLSVNSVIFKLMFAVVPWNGFFEPVI